MKRYTYKLYAPVILLFALIATLQAQPRGGMDPTEMIAREKQNLYKEVTDLSDDQKLLLDGIYEEYAQSFTEIRDEMMKTRDRENIRPKMQALRKEKDELIRDVLNEDQYTRYETLMENSFRRRREGGQPGERPGQDSTMHKRPIDN